MKRGLAKPQCRGESCSCDFQSRALLHAATSALTPQLFWMFLCQHQAWHGTEQSRGCFLPPLSLQKGINFPRGWFGLHTLPKSSLVGQNHVLTSPLQKSWQFC